MFGDKFLKIYENKGHGGVGLMEELTAETPEIENIVWQTIGGVFEEVLNPKYFKKTSENDYKNGPWWWKMSETDTTSSVLLYSTVPFDKIEGSEFL